MERRRPGATGLDHEMRTPLIFDESSPIALVFPGQGSQFVGMGQGLHEASATARRVFEQADDLLGFSLSRLCFHGSAEELEDTVNAQPAILTVSAAALEALKERAAATGERLAPIVLAGLLHQSAAFADEAEGGRKVEDAGGHQRRELAE